MGFNLNNVLSTSPTSGKDWVRPSDWPVITDTAGEVQFLFADTAEAKISFQVGYTGPNPTIDWGDGTTTTVTSSGSTWWNKTYTKGTGTPCSRGYTTFKIRVYGATTLTTVRPSVDPSLSFNVIAAAYTIGLLEAYYGNGTVPSGINSVFSSVNGPNSAVGFGYLEYVKMPATLNSAANYSYAFSNCYNLAVVVLPTSSPGATTWTSTFSGCQRITTVDFPNDTQPTRIDSMFQTCNLLKDVQLPDLVNCTRMDSAFLGCVSLNEVVIPVIGNSMTTFQTAFSGCSKLISVTFLGLPTSVIAITFEGTFQNCYKLENIIFPSSVSPNPTYNMTNTFNGCHSLRTFTLPSGFNAGIYASTFASCFALQYCNLVGSDAQPMTSFSSVFSNCYNLNEAVIPKPASSVGTVGVVTPFANCFSMETVNIPVGNKWGTLSLPINIKTLTLPAMDNVTNITITGLNYLEELILPAMPLLSNIAISQNNRSLKRIVLPTVTGVITNLTFQNNPVLETIENLSTLPTGLTSMANSFNNCYAIRNIVLPAVSNNFASYANTFVNCHALESITFPITQNTNGAGFTMAQAFNGCGSLKTINNFDKAQSNSANVNALLNFTANNNMNLVPGLTFSQRLTGVVINGTNATYMNRITSLRFLNTATNQWTATSPQINISYTRIGYAALVQLFNDIAATGTYTAKTINITGCDGAASLTAADRLIITSKGWTITG